ncbi:MAG: AlkZ family DNA glycosylase [Anaerolineales bacterium]|nr:AlkZ family DNA glycosylase [Anaerolineales bacterium]
MTEPLLTLRQLNRATLDRQLLLQRSLQPTLQAIAHLVGLQAQSAPAPYIGLWTRLQGFSRNDLAREIAARTVVKATMMRGTLHLVAANDYVQLRSTIQPVLAQAADSIAKRRAGADFDREELLSAATAYIEAQPRTFAEISDFLAQEWPDRDIGAMRYTVRTHLPLVQIPISTGWSYPGNPKFGLAESWLGQPISPTEHLRELVFRYLAAFGPATVADMQTWSGFGKLKELFERLRPELQIYRDERKREYFDIPGIPLPDGDTPAPERFLPEYDNLLLSHAQRARIIADDYRAQVYLPGLRVRSTILVDGFVRGGWKVERSRKSVTLVIEPFATLTSQSRTGLAEEGEQLLHFVEPDATSLDIRFEA